MFAGMAVRLAVDLGLHLDPPEEAGIGPEERRLNRLVFWSVVLLDFALAFGTGRQPTFRVDEITQCLPRDEDVAKLSGPDPLSHPFPYAVKQMFSYGYLIETLNSRKFGLDADAQQEIQRARILSIKEYAQLPLDLKWNVTKWVYLLIALMQSTKACSSGASANLPAATSVDAYHYCERLARRC